MITKAQYAQLKNNLESKGTGKRNIVQKLEDNLCAERPSPKAYNKARKGKANERNHGQFCVSVTLRISDKRNRDSDGALSTLLDSYCAAIGRLTAMDAKALGGVRRV